MAQEYVLITVTGQDTPGITARLTGIVAEEGAELVDIEQVVVHGQLTLCLVVGLPETRDMLKDILFAAHELGLRLDFKPLDARPGATGGRRGRGSRYVVTAIARGMSAREIHLVSSALSAHGANIDALTRLSEGEIGSVEIHVSLAPGGNSEPLKRELLALAMRERFDVALQRERLYRRSKRLVVMDMDSTLIKIEVIDELARAHGVVDRVSAITERAMQGEMDFDESLRQRVALLAGLDCAVLERLSAELPLTEGAEKLVKMLKRLGYRTAVISGGFSVAAEALKARLGIDYAYSNVLEVENGKLTGRVTGAIVNGERKAELLETLAKKENILLDQVIAVGDGANDLLMLQRAGLGIAFRAKQKLREAADTSISAAGLDAILFLLGISAREVEETLLAP